MTARVTEAMTAAVARAGRDMDATEPYVVSAVYDQTDDAKVKLIVFADAKRILRFVEFRECEAEIDGVGCQNEAKVLLARYDRLVPGHKPIRVCPSCRDRLEAQAKAKVN